MNTTKQQNRADPCADEASQNMERKGSLPSASFLRPERTQSKGSGLPNNTHVPQGRRRKFCARAARALRALRAHYSIFFHTSLKKSHSERVGAPTRSARAHADAANATQRTPQRTEALPCTPRPDPWPAATPRHRNGRNPGPNHQKAPREPARTTFAAKLRCADPKHAGRPRSL